MKKRKAERSSFGDEAYPILRIGTLLATWEENSAQIGLVKMVSSAFGLSPSFRYAFLCDGFIQVSSCWRARDSATAPGLALIDLAIPTQRKLFILIIKVVVLSWSFTGPMPIKLAQANHCGHGAKIGFTKTRSRLFLILIIIQTKISFYY